MDQDSVKLGLLVAAAQTHQKLAEAAIEKLNEHTQGLQTVASDQIQRALVEGLKSLHAEMIGAVEALQRVKGAANVRAVFWTLGVTAIALGVALFVAWWVLPTPAETAASRTERNALASNIAVLNQRGARADLRRCGLGRLCVRVDLKARRYGESSDYLVIRDIEVRRVRRAYEGFLLATTIRFLRCVRGLLSVRF
jgi:hypothetical protein